jgi:5'-AMP-activated protein kinase catalytic alpha subunit
VSSDFKDILKSILCTDPTNWFTLEQIRAHPWYNLSPPKETVDSGIIVGKDRILVNDNLNIQIDEEIFGVLEKFGFNDEYSRQCIESNKHNHLTTTYYLLLKKAVRSGRISCQ